LCRNRNGDPATRSADSEINNVDDGDGDLDESFWACF